MGLTRWAARAVQIGFPATYLPLRGFWEGRDAVESEMTVFRVALKLIKSYL